ncbi:hypothetical protein KL942_003380 [Ogataea angusta]|uniref:Uncharacterized protein n=1 Tax=Pichia angusta TaxID=870730 RepID=A0ABQ7RWC0_PICAN|nr:hypothetical protein KL942_003380 [Ogataea angusta]KAG7849402.1 hypothetical protein KL940_003084 [Ogataea angusta]
MVAAGHTSAAAGTAGNTVVAAGIRICQTANRASPHGVGGCAYDFWMTAADGSDGPQQGQQDGAAQLCKRRRKPALFRSAATYSLQLCRQLAT